MPTDAQINANRLNAQKSTGPTSPEGKAASRLNALKSGIDAHTQIIPGEDPAELEALAQEFHLHFHPADPNQLSLVDALVDAEWTQRRLRRIEAQLWTLWVERLHPSDRQNSPLGRAYSNALDQFTRIQRRIDANNRLYLRTLKALQDLQAAPPEPSTPVSEPASPVAAQPLTPQIGFVPQSAPAPLERQHVYDIPLKRNARPNGLY
jgi:hypothetical protein